MLTLGVSVSVCTSARNLVRGCVPAGVRARALAHPWQHTVQPAGAGGFGVRGGLSFFTISHSKSLAYTQDAATGD